MSRDTVCTVPGVDERMVVTAAIIAVTVAEEVLSIGSAELGVDGTFGMVDPHQLERFVAQATALVSAAP